MNKNVLFIATLACALFAQGCATPTVVETKQRSDAALGCIDIQAQIAEAEDYEKAARKERTVTGTNVAAAILFLPGLLGTYANTEEAINAAKERKAHLEKLAKVKNCTLI